MPDETNAVLTSDAIDHEPTDRPVPVDVEDRTAPPDRRETSDAPTDDERVGESGDGSSRNRRRFERLEGADADRVNAFLKERVDFTAREWAIARLCADFRTGTGVEMTNVGEHLPDLVPFVDEPYASGTVSSTRRSFVEKVRRAGATFLYGAYADFLTAEEVDDVVYAATEVAKFLIEAEGGTLSVDDELSAEERVRAAMAAVHDASLDLRYDRCPHCGEELGPEAATDAS